MSHTLAQAFNVSPRTARRYLAEFRTAPVAVGGNGRPLGAAHAQPLV